MNKQSVKLNKKQGLYVILQDNGYSCLGFDVCERRRAALAKELASLGFLPPPGAKVGTVGNFCAYARTQNMARLHYDLTGYRFKCGLHPALGGMEGKRVEVVNEAGEKRRFRVGKSTGWIPCHLELKNARSSGGDAISPDAVFVSVTVV